MTTPKPEEIDPYAISPAGLAFIPDSNRLWRVDLGFEVSPHGMRPRDFQSLSVAEQDRLFTEAITATEERLITLRYAQRIRAERIKDPSWLRKVLGLVIR